MAQDVPLTAARSHPSLKIGKQMLCANAFCLLAIPICMLPFDLILDVFSGIKGMSLLQSVATFAGVFSVSMAGLVYVLSSVAESKAKTLVLECQESGVFRGTNPKHDAPIYKKIEFQAIMYSVALINMLFLALFFFLAFGPLMHVPKE